ncbi:MAG: hypothetical protein M1831_000604 [Alyxoria varia]|nr:MAG: hypothetical protein M1831_000604 [Alyxoria varia]
MEEGSPERLTLGHTNVSRPQLAHTLSKQSVTATEEYQSARSSTPSSSRSNDDLLPPGRNFETPPTNPNNSSRSRLPLELHTRGPSPLQPINDTPERDEHSSIRFVESSIRRKPVGSGDSSTMQRRSQLNPEPSPPTPGVDDTPYIQFAIDQLTRDEEVRGSRRYAYPSDAQPSGYRQTSQEIYQKRAAEDYDSSPHNERPFLEAPERQPRTSEEIKESRTQYPPRTSSRPDFVDSAVRKPAILVPFDQEVPSLRFLPRILRRSMLAAFAFLCLLMITALLFSGIWSGMKAGLTDYTTFGGPVYFVFEYLPTICAMVILLWLLQIQIAIQRVTPFIGMASMSSKSRTRGPLMQIQPTSFLLPQLSNFSAGQPLVGVCMIIFWLQIFTVPLVSCLYNVYFYGDQFSGSWRWTTVQGIVWTLFALYLLLLIAIITLAIWINNRRTGLRWDVRTLADLIALLDRSNITKDYSKTEAFTTPREFQQRLSNRSDRLGYWHSSDRPANAFYTIGEEGADIRRYSLEQGKIREKEQIERSSFPDTPTTPGDDIDIESADDLERIRHRYLPWFLRPTILLFWCVAGILLYLAFLVVSFVNQAVIRGFQPLTNVNPTAAGFSSTNFTYSFIPAVIAQFLFLSWLSMDYAFRRLQSYAALSNPEKGATASNSLLLDYPSRLPVSVTISAITSGDFHVAWFSLMSLVAATLPILSGGCFWAQFFVKEEQVRVAVDPPGYYALCAFLALYAFSIPLAFIGLRRRKLPHAVTTLAEQFSWLYQSNLLGEREWRAPLASKPELVSRLVASATPGQGRNPQSQPHNRSSGRFVFGKYIGKDGKLHLGIDRLGRLERQTSGPNFNRNDSYEDRYTRFPNLRRPARSASRRSQ